MKVGDIIDGNKRITKVFNLCGVEAYQTEPYKPATKAEPKKAVVEPDFMPEPEPVEEPEEKAEPVIKRRGGRKKKE